MNTNIPLIVGAEYAVTHSRKGKFHMQVKSVGDPWITGTITSGKCNAMLDYNERECGEEITIRDAHSFFTIP